jgi:hypothetical protein
MRAEQIAGMAAKRICSRIDRSLAEWIATPI